MGINSGEFMGRGGLFCWCEFQHANIQKKKRKNTHTPTESAPKDQFAGANPLTQQGQQRVLKVGTNFEIFVNHVCAPRPGWYVAREALWCHGSCAAASATGIAVTSKILERPSLLDVKLRNKKALFLMLRNKTLNFHAKAFRGHFLS